MAEKKLHICGVSEKARFLDELRKEFGGGIPLRELQVKYLKKCLDIPIEECRFTAIKGLSEKDEFTGTIRDMLTEYYEIPLKGLTDKRTVKWLVKVFTEEEWIPDFNGVDKVAIKCVPIDRKVNQLEVETYLKELAKRELQ